MGNTVSDSTTIVYIAKVGKLQLLKRLYGEHECVSSQIFLHGFSSQINYAERVQRIISIVLGFFSEAMAV